MLCLVGLGRRRPVLVDSIIISTVRYSVEGCLGDDRETEDCTSGACMVRQSLYKI